MVGIAKNHRAAGAGKIVGKDYKYRGRTLTGLMTRQLIVEMFSGKDAVRRQELIDVCEKEHIKRGGIKHKDPDSTIKAFKSGIKGLRGLGIVEDAGPGYWHINPGHTPEEATAPIPRSISKKKRSELRKDLYAKQEGHCAGCNRPYALKDLAVDHMIPLSRGGSDDDANKQLLCTSCNSSKGAKTQDEFLASRRQ